MQSASQSRSVRRCRRGSLSVELLLVFPVLILLVAGIVQFALLITASQAVHAAASVGAREASLPSSTRATVERAVERSVGNWTFAASLNDVGIRVNGLPDSQYPLPWADTGDAIGVTVSVPATAAVPDVLGYIGLSIADLNLRSTYVGRRE